MSEKYDIGVKYYSKKQYDKALEYFQLAADQGFPFAQSNLGYMYHNGYHVEKSIMKAVQYFQLAADQGFLFAQSNLDYFKSSIEYIQYELSEQLKINDLLRQQIELLEAELKYEPDDNSYQEVLCSAKEPIESLSSDV
jgi:TPR repeat protein